MQDYTTLKEKAEEFRKVKDYQNALPIYVILWEQYRKECTKWEGWGYAVCLQNTQNYQKGLEICREVYGLDNHFSAIHKVYSWCIYYTEIKEVKLDKINESSFLKAAKAILKLSKQEDNFSPYILTVFKVVDYLATKTIYPSTDILEWCNKLDVNNLDSTPYTFINKTGEKQKGASKQEQYFAHCTKALFEKGLYDECIFMCQKALESLEEFHDNNAIWFARRISLSFKELGDTEIALELFQNLLKKKRDWFMYKEIAEIYFELEDNENALKYAIYGVLASANATENRDKKVNLYKLLAKLLLKTDRENKKEEAKKHIEFTYFIKKANNWKIDAELNQFLNQFEINKNTNLNVEIHEKELKKIWRELRIYKKPIQTGIINLINTQRKVGKIECDNGKFYSFKVSNFLFIQPWFRTGQTVTFYLEEGLNSTEKRKTENAFMIRIV